jgi:glucose/arabinose dehydrogenase
MRMVLGLLLALAAGAFATTAARAQCYPGLACPTDPAPANPPPANPQQKTAPETGLSQSARSGAEYHYVGQVAPPDDWLSLRTTPSDKTGSRIMKMPAGTKFLVREKRDPWWRVELRDGTTGWAHSDWIRCCKSANE